VRTPNEPKELQSAAFGNDGQAPFWQIDKYEFRVFFRKQQDRNSASRFHPAFPELTDQRLMELEQKVHQVKSKRAGDDFVKVTTEANIKDEYVKVKVLGKGKYAAVELWKLKADSKQKFAVKVFSKKSKTKGQIYDVINEFLLMKETLNHGEQNPHLVKLYRMVETPQTMNLLMEVVSGGELFQLLQKKKTFSEVESQWITVQLFKGLRHLHAKDIIHSDLKPENVMIDQARQHPYGIKIADFGLSEVLVDRAQGFTEWHGSPYYMAPELFRQDKLYDEKVDIWAVGIMLHEFFCGQPAIRARSRDDLKRNVITFKGFRKNNTQTGGVAAKGQSDYGKTILAEWDKFKIPVKEGGPRELLLALLQPSANDRPTANEILDRNNGSRWLDPASRDKPAGNAEYSGNAYPALTEKDFPARQPEFSTTEFQHLSRVLTRMKAEQRLKSLAAMRVIVHPSGAVAEGGSVNLHPTNSVAPGVKEGSHRESSACGNCSVM